MTQIFASRPELMPMGETTEEHGKWQAEEAALVEKDRTDTGPRGGLFRGCFRRDYLVPRLPSGYMTQPPIRDIEDGVERCPRCTWELEDGLCQSCGYPSGDDDELSETDSRDDDVDFDGEEDDMDEDGSVMFGEDYHAPPQYLAATLRDLDYLDRLEHARSMNPYPNEPGTPYDSTFDGSYGVSDHDDADPGSLDDFVVEDEEERQHSPLSSARNLRWETDDSDGAENSHSQLSANDIEARAETISDGDGMSLNDGHTDNSDPEEDSDEGPIPPPRRHMFPRRQLLSASGSDDEMQSIAMPRERRYRPTAWMRSNGTSHAQHSMPHHSRCIHTNGARSDAVLIDGDSDSDAPVSASQPIRHRRNHRPGPLNEESGAEGSSGTATIGRVSSGLNATQRHDDQPDEQHSTYREAYEEPQEPTQPYFPPGHLSLDGTHSSSPVSPDHNRPSPDTQRNQISRRRRSPLPPWSHRHASAPGSSQSQAANNPGARDRGAHRERQAERRRRKADRQRRRSPETARLAAPL